MTATSSVVTRDAKPERLLFIDNIRIFLTILVILHHLMITYAGEEIGGWIYYDYRPDDITAAVGRWFCSLNQSYFMGLFLFVSAYFVPGAYDRKGAKRFLKDRLIRLGIPLVLYGWVIRPLWYFYTFNVPGTYWSWFFGGYLKYFGFIGGGPLWFIEVLLIFACFYAIYRQFKSQPVHPIPDAQFPSSRKIIVLAILLGIVSSIVQIWFPPNTTITELNLQLANFPQYISMFVLGLMAYPRNWFASLPDKTSRRWMTVVFLLSFLPILVGFSVNPQAGSGVEAVLNLISNWWISFMCVGMSITVVYFFRKFVNQQGRIAAWASRNAYTAYLVHEPIIATTALLLSGMIIYPLLKFALVALIAVPLTFLLSALIRNIPYTDRVL